MHRTLVIALHDSEIIDHHILCGNLDAHDLSEVCKVISQHHRTKLEDFYRMLGFARVRRHTDMMHFVDLDLEFEACIDVPDNLFKALGINH